MKILFPLIFFQFIRMNLNELKIVQCINTTIWLEELTLTSIS